MNASTDMEVSLRITERLLSMMPPNLLAQLRNTLVRVYCKQQPEQKRAIIEHANNQIRMTHNIRNIDWSEISVPVTAEICQAVWDFYVNESVLQNIKRDRQ